MILGLPLWLGLAHAAVPLPDYRRELARARWYEVNAVLEDACRYEPLQRAVACSERVEQAVEAAQAFQRHVFPDAGLTYLVALAERYQGEDRRAEASYRKALELDTEYDAAWHDLGELLLKRGDLDGAAEAFARVTALRTAGQNAWVGPWREAEVAAHRRDAPSFERHLKEALRRGFRFRTISGLPNWRAFYADPVLRTSITKLVTVYSDPSILETLEGSNDEGPPR